jgi:hypothetical protein
MRVVDMLGAAAAFADENTAGAVKHHHTDARSIGEGFEGRHRDVLLSAQVVLSAQGVVNAAREMGLWLSRGNFMRRAGTGRRRVCACCIDEEATTLKMVDRCLSSTGFW